MGSSPRGRGKPSETPRLLRSVGLIPAWAGKTPHEQPGCLSQGAHPRVGGENLRLGRHHAVVRGSSPRGRGKPESKRPVHEDARLIPAWAGKTCASGWTSLTAWAHPRVGGENIGASWLPTIVKGSSPRGRGKPRPSRPLLRPCGLIPAWAGKTWPGMLNRGARRAHPRVGGENSSSATPTARAGLIPAWAGKTDDTGGETRIIGAHPRVGGENIRRPTSSPRSSGSSPRGRGKRSARRCMAPVRGLIPAWAGKTGRSRGPRQSTGAHPRVGGENDRDDINGATASGSSPRGREKLAHTFKTDPWHGLIPAWAGKTSHLSCLSFC